MTRDTDSRSYRGEQCRGQMTCCCFPCLLLWSTLETLLKGCCITSLYICSCQCFKQEGTNITPYYENTSDHTMNEINEIDEELKDATI